VNSKSRPLDEVFSFFADASNLQEITPPWLHFEIVTQAPITMAQGTLIQYRIRLHGLPLHWLTRIIHWDPPHEFVDVQIRVLYVLWEHTHCFVPDQGGTRILDEVRYALPFAPLSTVFHKWPVRRDLDAIFDFRPKAVESHFARSTSLLPRA
jgi:ligand-binding SRPBCC domain-containing protein